MPSAPRPKHTFPPRQNCPRATFEMLLASGGDERICLDPLTGRNRYGTPIAPAEDEVWFSSSTATAISPRGYAAAKRAFDNLIALPAGGAVGASTWFDSLRARIVACFGVEGTQAILCASGTEAEVLALTIAKSMLRRPLRNIVVAPKETGSGVMAAAAGRHFNSTSALRGSVAKGETLAGWESTPVQLAPLEIRNMSGRLRQRDIIDRGAQVCVNAALRAGEDVLLHVLDTSKTGQGGPSRNAARDIARANPGRVFVLVDACQLRCSFAAIKADLEAGFLVMITGSKFAAGPPFCGALLIPPQHVAALSRLRPPPGLAAYSARFDWPPFLRATLPVGLFAPINLGLALRWEAALAEIEAYAATDPLRREHVASAFSELVVQCVTARSHLRFLDGQPAGAGASAPTIFPVVTRQGKPEQALAIYEALRANRAADAPSRVCNVGQPVVIANRSALRICISMPIIIDAAAKLEAGADVHHAIRRIQTDLETVFEKWDRVLGIAQRRA